MTMVVVGISGSDEWERIENEEKNAKICIHKRRTENERTYKEKPQNRNME